MRMMLLIALLMIAAVPLFAVGLYPVSVLDANESWRDYRIMTPDTVQSNLFLQFEWDYDPTRLPGGWAEYDTGFRHQKVLQTNAVSRPLFTNMYGNGYGARYFSGQSNFLDLGTVANFPSNVAWQVWVLSDADFSDYQCVFGYDVYTADTNVGLGAGHNSGWQFRLNAANGTSWPAGSIQVYEANAVVADQTNVSQIAIANDGQWHFYAGDLGPLDCRIWADTGWVVNVTGGYQFVYPIDESLSVGCGLNKAGLGAALCYSPFKGNMDKLKIIGNYQWSFAELSNQYYSQKSWYTNPPGPVGATDLVLYANFDAPTNFLGGTNWNVVDSGFGRTVTVAAASRPLQEVLADGATNGFVFNGSSDYIDFGYSKPYTSHTYAAFLKTTSSGSYVNPLSRYDYTAGDAQEHGDYIRINLDGTMTWRILNGASGSLLLTTKGVPINNNGWFHVAVVCYVDPANSANNLYTFYVNGIQIDQSNVNFVVAYTTNAHEVVAAAYDPTDGIFGDTPCHADDVRFYNRPLVSNEIYALFSAAPSTNR